jgi:hypothetical protein
MPRYILSGDIVRAVRVEIEADSPEEAIALAENNGLYSILEEFPSTDDFTFDGDDDHIEEIS